MKSINLPELFGNIPPDTQFKIYGDGAVCTRQDGCLMVGNQVVWTLDMANNHYLCWPVHWTKIMAHSYLKATKKKGQARIQRIFWESHLMSYRPRHTKTHWQYKVD